MNTPDLVIAGHYDFRLVALSIVETLEAALGLVAERDRTALVATLATEARRITLAQHASAGLLAGDGPDVSAFCAIGVPAATGTAMRPRSIDGTIFTSVIGKGRPLRLRKRNGIADRLGLPAGQPPISSFLTVPIASATRAHGWLFLSNKLGTDEFTEADERVAMALGTIAGVRLEG